METLSSDAAAILEVMERNRPYDASELRSLLPRVSREGLREIMHELWVKRRVERFGYSGWRRQESSCASHDGSAPRSCATCRIASTCADCVALAVRPEQLFEHAAFAGMFK